MILASLSGYCSLPCICGVRWPYKNETISELNSGNTWIPQAGPNTGFLPLATPSTTHKNPTALQCRADPRHQAREAGHPTIRQLLLQVLDLLRFLCDPSQHVIQAAFQLLVMLVHHVQLLLLVGFLSLGMSLWDKWVGLSRMAEHCLNTRIRDRQPE